MSRVPTWFNGKPGYEPIFCAAVDEDTMEIATPMFEYAGELGDSNALYTYAHLLKQGELRNYVYGKKYLTR